MKKQLVARRIFVTPIFKDKATVLKTTEETGGAYTLGELQVMPGGGDYLHTNNAFEETFTAVSDTKPTGLQGMLFPVFKWLAKKAKKKGIEKALLEKYYY